MTPDATVIVGRPPVGDPYPSASGDSDVWRELEAPEFPAAAAAWSWRPVPGSRAWWSRWLRWVLGRLGRLRPWAGS